MNYCLNTDWKLWGKIMKKCPVCNAEIEDNARFCLYCMTSFDEKTEIREETKKRVSPLTYITVAAVLMVLIVALIVALKDLGGKEKIGSPDNTKSMAETATEEAEPQTVTEPEKSQPSTENENITGNDSISSGQTSSKNNDGSSEAESKSQSDNIATANSTAEYIWRDAKQSDDFYTAANIENCVVITGVKTAAKSGEYIIPDTLGGKKVIAIMGGAFSGDGIKKTVKKVTVSANVKSIWNYAFGGCNNLTDIYFKGTSIYTDAFAFDIDGERVGILTIHCSADCNDRDFRYYKNTAPNYDAVWKEWNG